MDLHLHTIFFPLGQVYCWCFPLCFLFDPLFLVSTFFWFFFYFQNLSSLLNFPMSDLSFTHQIICYLLTFSPVCSSFPACLLLPFRRASWSEIAWLSKIIFEVTEHFFTNKVLKSLSISVFKYDIEISVWCFRRKMLPCFCFLWFLVELIHLLIWYIFPCFICASYWVVDSWGPSSQFYPEEWRQTCVRATSNCMRYRNSESPPVRH